MNRTAGLLGALVIFAGARAHAQYSDLMPDPAAAAPPPPTSAAGRLYPPLAGSASQSGQLVDENGGVRTGERGGAPGKQQQQLAPNAGRGEAILDDDDRAIRFDNGAPMVEKVPEVHVVQRGDTLWDISDGYFRNPWYWPKLWSFNPLITNPHWIYPGDLVRLYPPGATHAEAPRPPALPNKEPETPRFSVARPAAPTGILLRQTGFVEPGELDAAATIVGSREEKILLSALDEAYVEFKADKPLRQGSRYTIYRVESEVRHPQTDKVIGSLVEIMGDVEVRGFGPAPDDENRNRAGSDRIARALIVDAVNPIERGYRVGPLRRQFKMVEPVADHVDLVGMVVATLRPTKLVGSEQLVFLDRGKNDQVAAGNRLMVVRRGDGYRPMLAAEGPDDQRYPREVVAEVLVVDVRDTTSTGVVTRALKEVQVGDHVEARKGY